MPNDPTPTHQPEAQPGSGQSSPLEGTTRSEGKQLPLPADGLASGGNQGAEMQRDWNEKKRS